MTRGRGALAGLLAAGTLVVAVPGAAPAAAPVGDDCVQINQAEGLEKEPPTVPSAPTPG